jgi:hypothetical protein
MPTAKKKAPGTQRKAPRRTSKKYYRNLREVPVGFRLTESDRRVDLAPRGQRGDIAAIVKEDQSDPIFAANEGLIFEIITQEEADLVIEKQQTNIQKEPRHTALDSIRNEHGDPYEDDAVRLASEEEAQGKAVAPLDGEGNLIIDRNVGIRRAAVPGSTDYELPHIPDSVNPEDQGEYLKDLRAKTQREQTRKSE